MRTVKTTLEDKDYDRLDQLAGKMGISIAALLRLLVLPGLKAAELSYELRGKVKRYLED